MTKTLFITHPDCVLHEMGEMHPEQPARITAIESRLKKEGLYDRLEVVSPPLATDENLTKAHSPSYLAEVRSIAPESGYADLDADTAMNPDSLNAALRAAGAAVLAVDLVLEGKADNAFCCVRPPGHHALRDQAMGFCIFNNVAVGACHALSKGLERVAILDFDVHHGNGTEGIFLTEERVLFCSTFQHPHYPYSSLQCSRKGIVKSPLPAGSGGKEFRNAVLNDWLPALAEFQPEMVFFSAGFDAHEEDPLGNLRLVDGDYRWVTDEIRKAANALCKGRVVSCLEGGYNLDALGRAATAHIAGLME